MRYAQVENEKILKIGFPPLEIYRLISEQGISAAIKQGWYPVKENNPPINKAAGFYTKQRNTVLYDDFVQYDLIPVLFDLEQVKVNKKEEIKEAAKKASCGPCVVESVSLKEPYSFLKTTDLIYKTVINEETGEEYLEIDLDNKDNYIIVDKVTVDSRTDDIMSLEVGLKGVISSAYNDGAFGTVEAPAEGLTTSDVFSLSLGNVVSIASFNVVKQLTSELRDYYNKTFTVTVAQLYEIIKTQSKFDENIRKKKWEIQEKIDSFETISDELLNINW